MLCDIKKIYKHMNIPELEKEYLDLLILSSYSDNTLYCSELIYYIKKLIKNLKDKYKN